jgi:F-type H+-transporting ATPase subunit epsilon
MPTLKFQLVTPKGPVLSETVESLSCPTTQGQITILPGHIPLVATLAAGELVAKTKGVEHILHVAGGFVEVRKHNEVILLADEAEHFYEIDQVQVEEAKQRAEEIMKEKNLSAEEYAAASASLERSLSRLRVARKHAHRRRAPITSEGVLGE